MAPYADYSSLSRRELQALCKQHKIPANKTNAFMAEALDALLNNAPRQQEGFQEEEPPAPDSPEVEKVVEKVKGKRAPKKALLPDPEVDSLAGLLANSSLNSHAQVEMINSAPTPEKVSEEPTPSEDLLPLASIVVVPRARRGRPRITKKEEKAADEPISQLAETDENTIIASVNVPASELAEEVTMEEAQGWPKTWVEAAVEAGSLPARTFAASEEQPDEEQPVVYIRTKNKARLRKAATSETIVAEESDAMEEVQLELTSSFTDLGAEPTVEAEETSPSQEVETKIIKPKVADVETRRNAEIEEAPEFDIKSDSSVVSAESEQDGEEMLSEPIVKEPEETVLAPAEEKKSRTTKKAGSKSRRMITASAEEAREEVVAKQDEVSTEETVFAPVEEKTSRKTKKAVSKSRRKAEFEVQTEAEWQEVQMNDQVLPEVASFTTAEPFDEPKEATEAETSYNWTSPKSILEEDLPPLKHNSFTISPSVPREKPKARKTKKASVKSRKNAEQPAAAEEDVRTCTDGQLPAVSEDMSIVSATREAEAAVNMSTMEADKENLGDQSTPVKKSAVNDLGEDELLSLSMRKLVRKCKEKGLRTRGTNNTRSIKL